MVITNSTIAGIKQATKDNIISTFTHMAFGTGTFSGLSSATSLNNELVTNARQEYTELSNSVVISGFLSKTEQNGSVIKEAGCKEGSTGTLHSGKAIDVVNKTSSVELWIDNEISINISQ